MKRVGILTFHKSINYGSILQAWALQQYLNSVGYLVEIIDYEPDAYGLLYATFIKRYNWSDIKQNIKRIPIIREIKKQAQMFENFRVKNMKLSSIQYTANSNLELLTERYDCIVCGSDQIWNIWADDCDSAFFLPISHRIKKIAYAVSINNTDFSELRYKNNLRTWIEDFDKISIREISGAKKLERYLDGKRKIDIALDPTLLHEKEKFSSITSERIICCPYIFMYYAWYNKQIAEAGSILAERLGLPVYTGFMNKDTKKIIELHKKGIRSVLKYTSPENFLSLIANAEYTITDSFHGTAFSLIMEKPFICINYRNSDKQLKNDERISAILDRLGLLERYMTIEQLQSFDVLKKIDYMHITEQRMRMAKESKTWLINAIEK